MSAAAGASSKLDTDKFRKVHVMMTGGATDGERSAAKARATAMAGKAGLSLDDAVSSLDAKPSKPRSIFDEMMDADPEWRASHDASMAERDRRNAALRAEALAEYGSEDAVWAETEQERLLREALEPLADWKTFANSGNRYIAGYAGWVVGRPTLPLFEALRKAYPFAYELVGLWREYQEWERLYTLREAFSRHYDFETHVRARIAGLAFNLDTLPDPTFEGFETRLAWLKFRTERDMSSDVHDDLSMIATMRMDLAMLKATHAPRGEGASQNHASPVQTGHRTTAEKRAAVLSMLDTHSERSDREIARRVGVSPQTVNTWRKKRGS